MWPQRVGRPAAYVAAVVAVGLVGVQVAAAAPYGSAAPVSADSKPGKRGPAGPAGPPGPQGPAGAAFVQVQTRDALSYSNNPTFTVARYFPTGLIGKADANTAATATRAFTISDFRGANLESERLIALVALAPGEGAKPRAIFCSVPAGNIAPLPSTCEAKGTLTVNTGDLYWIQDANNDGAATRIGSTLTYTVS